MLASAAAKGEFSWEDLGVRTNRPLGQGLLRSERSNFNMGMIDTQYTLAPGTAFVVFDIIEEAMPIGVISWVGWGIASITDFRVNVYRINFDTRDFEELLHESDNIAGLLEGTGTPGAIMRYELPDPVAAEKGNLLAYEFITVGGSHTMRGHTFAIPDDPVAPTGNFAATYTVVDPTSAPDSLDRDDFTWTQNTPWVGLAVDTGSGGDHRDPVLVAAVDDSHRVPRVELGRHHRRHRAPRGRRRRTRLPRPVRNPGKPGSFDKVTWKKGVHFDAGDTITWDGATLSIPGYSLTAAPGARRLRAVARHPRQARR